MMNLQRQWMKLSVLSTLLVQIALLCDAATLRGASYPLARSHKLSSESPTNVERNERRSLMLAIEQGPTSTDDPCKENCWLTAGLCQKNGEEKCNNDENRQLWEQQCMKTAAASTTTTTTTDDCKGGTCIDEACVQAQIDSCVQTVIQECDGGIISCVYKCPSTSTTGAD